MNGDNALEEFSSICFLVGIRPGESIKEFCARNPEGARELESFVRRNHGAMVDEFRGSPNQRGKK